MIRRVCLAIVLVLVTALAARAQSQAGSVTGVVTDQQGSVLPGAALLLAGEAYRQSFVTAEDGRFRFLNVPPGAYKLTAELSGFATMVRTGVVVAVGTTVDLPIEMAVSALSETVTVSGATPMVDTRAVGTATTFSQDELAKVPTARDPWALLRTVPGVTLDRVNIGGNETGQQSSFSSKGTPQRDSVWTLDGVPITDTATIGSSPTYFDYDAFDEIQISTSGQDLRQPSAGAGLNFVVKRGTNQFKATARAYFTNAALESENVPDELRQRGVTGDTADHNDQISDVGIDAGGPILSDRLFYWASYTQQDIRLIRQAGGVRDRTLLKTGHAKVNWQATKKDMVNFLWFDGRKEKYGRAVGIAQVEPASARWNQKNYYPDNPFRGLWKIEDNRVISNTLFLTGRYSYYGAGFTLEPVGGLNEQAGFSQPLGRTFGSTYAQYFLRPQHAANVDGQHSRQIGSSRHDIKMGAGFRQTDAFANVIWPGNMIQARELSATDRRARVYREGNGKNRSRYVHAYLGDTIAIGRVTADVGVRYDRQWGEALASDSAGNPAFPSLVPAVSFPGYGAPFVWNTISPRAGMTVSLDASRKTLLRASIGRYAGQLTGINQYIGYSNPSASAGWVEYPWQDQNGDNLAQADEVNVAAPPLAFFNVNPSNPGAVSSPNTIDPNLAPSRTLSAVVGFDRELLPDFAMQVSYSYSRTTGIAYTPWRGLTEADYRPGQLVTGTLPGGEAYDVQTYIPDPARVAANGNGRILTNFDGYRTTYNGLEVAFNKRMSGRWMMRASFALNNPRAFYDAARVNSIGNPTPLDGFSTGGGALSNPSSAADPLVNGGQLAPTSTGSGAGEVFINAKWQMNVNGAYQLPYGLEAAANLFGKQGTPLPAVRSVPLGLDGSQNVLVTPRIDTARLDDLWNLDLRLSRTLRAKRTSVQVIGDLFNVFNSNVGLNRQRSVASPTFNQLTSNLSPRILRLGVRVGF